MVLFKIAGGEVVPQTETTSLDTILDLKGKIQKELDVEVSRQNVWHKDRMLRDNELILDCGFHVSETLHPKVTPLSPQHKLSVMLKFIGGDAYVELKETDKVSDLRNTVERQWGIPSELISLKRCNTVMKDNLPLFAYYVNEGSEVQLSLLIEHR